MKSLITILLLLISTNVLANNSCNNIQTEYKINTFIEPITYVYNLKTYQIQQLAKQHSSSPQEANTHTLGFLQSELSISNAPQYTMISETFSNKLCGKIKTNTLNIKMKPTIYIASDIIGIPCIAKQTMIHEQTHFQFHSDAIKNISNTYKNTAIQYLNGIQFGDQDLIKSNFSSRNQLFVQQINNMYNNYVTPRDNYLDDPRYRNKQIETCPFIQQQQLNQLLLGY